MAGWPLLRTVALGFTDARLSDLGAAHWVGLDDFACKQRRRFNSADDKQAALRITLGTARVGLRW